MKEYIFEELGYFTESQCKALKNALQGSTFMNFDIAYSSYAGNCILIVKTDYEAAEQEVKEFFLHSVLSKLAELY